MSERRDTTKPRKAARRDTGRHGRFFRWGAALVLVATTAAGCRTWTPVTELPSGELPGRARVTIDDDVQFEIADGRVHGDSLLVLRSTPARPGYSSTL